MNQFLKLFLFVLFLPALTGCCDNDQQISWLSIRNDTPHAMHCTVYPSPETYTVKYDFYLESKTDWTDFTSSGDMGLSSTALLDQNIDSIRIIVEDSLQTVILFNRDGGNGKYRIDPFKSNRDWKLETLYQDFPTNFCRNRTKVFNHLFPIDMSNIQH